MGVRDGGAHALEQLVELPVVAFPEKHPPHTAAANLSHDAAAGNATGRERRGETVV
jgi:hypothetical protein